MKLISSDFWKANTSYVSTGRYKSFIMYNGALYICNETHLSTDEFDANKFDAINAGNSSSYNLTIDDVVRLKGTIDSISTGSAPMTDMFGFTWVNQSTGEIQAFNGNTMVTINPAHLQRFVYGPRSMELFYNATENTFQLMSGYPNIEVDIELYALFSNSSKWIGTEQKSTHYIRLQDVESTFTINLANYTNALIDCSISTPATFTANMMGPGSYDTNTVYIKEHKIVLVNNSEGSTSINFNQMTINGLVSSIVDIAPFTVIELKVLSDYVSNKLIYVSGYNPIKKLKVSEIANSENPNVLIGSKSKLYIEADSEYAIFLYSMLTGTQDSPCVMNVKYKNTAQTTPNITLVITNDFGNPNVSVSLPITDPAGSFDIVYDGIDALIY